MTHMEEADRLLRFVEQEVRHKGIRQVMDERVDITAAQIEATLAVAEELHTANLIAVAVRLERGDAGGAIWHEVVERLELHPLIDEIEGES